MTYLVLHIRIRKLWTSWEDQHVTRARTHDVTATWFMPLGHKLISMVHIRDISRQKPKEHRSLPYVHMHIYETYIHCVWCYNRSFLLIHRICDLLSLVSKERMDERFQTIMTHPFWSEPAIHRWLSTNTWRCDWSDGFLWHVSHFSYALQGCLR